MSSQEVRESPVVDPPKTKIPCEPVDGKNKLAEQVVCFVRNREYVLNTRDLAPNPIAVLAMMVEQGIFRRKRPRGAR